MIFLMLTKTWLTDHFDAEVNIDGFFIHRADRNHPKISEEETVAVYLRNDVDIATEVLLQFLNDVIEVICLRIPTLNWF